MAAGLPGHPSGDRRAYALLFTAQVLALLGTGVATVALALLSYRLAGAEAGAVFGTALAIKAGTSVVLGPLASVLTIRLPRRAVLVAADLVRAAVALAMPFVTTVVQVNLLIFVFQAAAAVFTPLFQATIPELLPEEAAYARALARARLASELEGAISPILAAGLLLLVDGPTLFVCTACALLLSAGLILATRLPPPVATVAGPWSERLARGLRLFAATPRLRGLILLLLAAACGTAMVVVNTVVLVEERLIDHDRETAIGLGSYGVGSVLGTLTVPRLLARRSPRTVMLAGGSLVAAALLLGAAVPRLLFLLPLWVVIGIGTSFALAPYGLLLRRSAEPADKLSLYAAHVALSQLALLMAYPIAGQLGARFGMVTTFLVLGGLSVLLTTVAARIWRSEPLHERER